MLKLLNLSFIPRSTDFGLLVLRVSLGLSMLLLHGKMKLMGFSALAPKFEGIYGLPGNVNLGLAVFAEVACSVLLVLGLLTRFAALLLTITMATAFFLKHGMALSGANSGELALLYLIGYVTLFFAGAGRISMDRA